MAPDELKTRARRVVEEILNQGDLAVAKELISPDCVHHIPGGPPVPGLTALRDWLALTLSIFPDFHAIVEDEIAEDDRVVQRITCYGTHEGEFSGVRPTGQQVSFPDHRYQPGRSGREIRRALVDRRSARRAAPARRASAGKPALS
jgi:predicted ester cyclase